MAELTWTAEAERWLRDIHDYIAQDNPAAATRTVEALYQKAEVLREFPESFPNQATATGSDQIDTSASCFTGTIESHTWSRVQQ